MSTASPHNPSHTSGVPPNPTGTETPTASNARPATSAPPPPDPTGLTDEAPPAYTPGPDVYQGEATLEYGPHRPFQPPPSQPPTQHLQPMTPQPTGWSNGQNNYRPPAQLQLQSLWQQITTQIINPILNPPSNHNALMPRPTGSGWSAYPGHQPPPPRLSSRLSGNLPPPPPLHPASPNNHSRRTPSDFAQDFYAVGPGQTPPDESPRPISPQPPPIPSNRPAAHQTPDDGRPTNVPVPGHPLLNDGKLLVYPSGYECGKCANTGYKRNDPKNPCRKCWSKYSKPFSGALAYTPFTPPSAGGPAPPSGSKSFQRPLPYQAPPPIPLQQQYHPPPMPSQRYGNPGPWNQPPLHVQQLSAFASPPPGAIVYPPGDPRIGGRLCWQCDGKGRIGFLIFEEGCEACGGMGRVFR